MSRVHVRPYGRGRWAASLWQIDTVVVKRSDPQNQDLTKFLPGLGSYVSMSVDVRPHLYPEPRRRRSKKH